MTVLGVLARVSTDDRQQAVDVLEQLPGVSTFSVGEEERVGILIESEDVDNAHRTLKESVARVPGVLGTWPVFSHFGDEPLPLEQWAEHPPATTEGISDDINTP